MNTNIGDTAVERYCLALKAIRDFKHDPLCTANKLTNVYECGCYEKSQAQIACEALGTHIPETVVCPRCQT